MIDQKNYVRIVSIVVNPVLSVWRFFKKLIELPYDPVIPLLGIYQKECKTGYSRDTCTLMYIAALIIIAKL
jgi:hypothetical protein